MTTAPALACQCEHIDHETPNEQVHPPHAVEAGTETAMLVGPICDDCANGHLAEYVMDPDRPGYLRTGRLA